MKNKIRSAFLISASALMFYLFLSYLAVIPSKYNSAILLASAIVYINFIIFVLTYYLANKKDTKTFIIYTLGSLIIRLFLMIIAVILSIKFLKIDVVGFIFAFFIWYIFLLIYEIFIVQSAVERRKN